MNDQLLEVTNALDAFGLTSKISLEGYISDTDVLKIVRLQDDRMIYYNSVFFGFCSYTCEEIILSKYTELYSFSSTFMNWYKDLKSNFAKGEGTIWDKSWAGGVKEKFSSGHYEIKFSNKLAVPLYSKNGEVEAALFIQDLEFTQEKTEGVTEDSVFATKQEYKISV